MERQQFRAQLMQELPPLLKEDPTLRVVLWDLLRPYFADREKTEDRFEQLLKELKQLREESNRRWEESQKRWEAWEKRWEEERREWNRRWEENQKRWEENQKRWEAWEKRWEEERREWNRRWEENQNVIRELMREIKRVDRRIDTTLGALGARWGVRTEASFRHALAGLLQDLAPGVEVLRVVEWDEEGQIFGYPEQVELDLIIKDGELIIGEIKSSMSKADIYIFERKARFYERRHNRKAKRLVVISPMVEPKAQEMAQRLGIEVYTHAEDAASKLS